MQTFERNEAEFCPECGQHESCHTYRQSSATEPPEMWCGGGESSLDREPRRFDEPTYNQFNEPGYWIGLDGIEF